MWNDAAVGWMPESTRFMMCSILSSGAAGFRSRSGVLGRRGRRRHPHPRGAPSLGADDGEPGAVVFDDVAGLRQPAELGHHEAAERRVRALGKLHPGDLGDLVEIELAVDLDLAAGEP